MCSGRAKSYRIVCKGPCGGLPEAEREGDSSDARPVLCPAQLGGTEPPRALPRYSTRSARAPSSALGARRPSSTVWSNLRAARAIGHGLALVRDGACGSRRSQASPPSPWVRSFGAPIAAATSETCSTTARPLEERPPLNPGYGLGYGTPGDGTASSTAPPWCSSPRGRRAAPVSGDGLSRRRYERPADVELPSWLQPPKVSDRR